MTLEAKPRTYTSIRIDITNSQTGLNHVDDQTKPVTAGEMLVEEFITPLGLTHAALAAAMGVQRKHVNELCNGRRAVTAPTALILGRVFGTPRIFC